MAKEEKPPQKMVPCSQCDLEFPNRGEMMNHVRAAHPKEGAEWTFSAEDESLFAQRLAFPAKAYTLWDMAKALGYCDRNDSFEKFVWDMAEIGFQVSTGHVLAIARLAKPDDHGLSPEAQKAVKGLVLEAIKEIQLKGGEGDDATTGRE